MGTKRIGISIFFLTLGIFFLTYLYKVTFKNNSAPESHHTKPIPLNEKTKTLQFNVYGMTCEQCESKIMSLRDTEPGIYKIHVSYLDSRGYIKYDDKILTETKILEAIHSLGYSASKRRPIRIKSVDYNVQFKSK
jgi:copper chaperone CopZ